jgi:maintenance of morphology protein 1
MVFTFLDDYRLDFSIRSLLGSRSRLQDVPKIAQLVESRLHQWFDDRCVEPRFQEIALPSMWPRKKNTRGGDDTIHDVERSMSKAKGVEIAKDLRDAARKEVEVDARTDGAQDSLRYRRRPRAEDVFMSGSMPGSMPGVGMDTAT